MMGKGGDNDQNHSHSKGRAHLGGFRAGKDGKLVWVAERAFVIQGSQDSRCRFALDQQVFTKESFY